MKLVPGETATATVFDVVDVSERPSKHETSSLWKDDPNCLAIAVNNFDLGRRAGRVGQNTAHGLAGGKTDGSKRQRRYNQDPHRPSSCRAARMTADRSASSPSRIRA